MFLRFCKDKMHVNLAVCIFFAVLRISEAGCARFWKGKMQAKSSSRGFCAVLRSSEAGCRRLCGPEGQHACDKFSMRFLGCLEEF